MKKWLYRSRQCIALLLVMGMVLCGCASSGKEETGAGTKSVSESASQALDEKKTGGKEEEKEEETKQKEKQQEESAQGTGAQEKAADGNAPEIPGLTFESAMELTYAESFDVYFYQGGYALIDIHDSAKYLVIPENGAAPEGLAADIVVLQKPFEHIYLAATSAMSLFDALDALDKIRMTGTRESGWYIENAVKAMESGAIIFAGKYSEPDYELLVEENCDLAIESTMILHTPKVKEMIEMLDIPVLIDRSSYENHPLGRTEWIKIYGVLADKEKEAEAFFDQQAKVIGELKDFKNTEKTVVYFYINTNGSAVVRRADDYIPGMIEAAGGRYAFPDLVGEQYTSASVSLTMEEFYAVAVDADYLVYNAAIDAPISSLDELLAKSDLFADFKAVKEGNVWTTGKSLYQATDIVGEMIRDLNLMLTDGEEKDMTFLTRVQ